MMDRIAFYAHTMISRFIYFLSPNKIKKLKNERDSLVQETLDFVNKHIKEIDPKYEKERILYKNEIERGEGDNEILLKRSVHRKSKDYVRDEVDGLIKEIND